MFEGNLQHGNDIALKLINTNCCGVAVDKYLRATFYFI
jgi:hypothetical protein